MRTVSVKGIDLCKTQCFCFCADEQSGPDGPINQSIDEWSEWCIVIDEKQSIHFASEGL